MRHPSRKDAKSNALTPLLEPTHFRLCHFCSYLNESKMEIIRCAKCDKPVTLHVEAAQFLEEEDERWDNVKGEYVPWQSLYPTVPEADGDEPLVDSENFLPISAENKIPRLQGLCVVWEDW